MKRPLWRAEFGLDGFNRLPCPACMEGQLKIVSNSLAEKISEHSTSKNNPHDWEPTYLDEGFALLLECSSAKCGQIVSSSGSKELVEYVSYDEDGVEDWGYHSVYHPRSFYPAPVPIHIPDECPADVRKALHSAFQIMWADEAASAAKIRFSLELLLDHLGVPRTAVSKKGKTIDLNLMTRIDRLAQNNDAYKDTLHALRVVGNLGVHEGKVAREALLDVLEVYEHALDEIVGEKSIKIKALAKKLIDSGKKPGK